MELKRLCIEDLNFAIELCNELKSLIAQNKITEAINIIADILFVTGQTLLCINRVEFNQMLNTHESDSLEEEHKTTDMTPGSLEKLCLQLVDRAINDFQQAKRFIKQNQLEDAENIIAATLTGRILRCVNSLREEHHQSHLPIHGHHSKKDSTKNS